MNQTDAYYKYLFARAAQAERPLSGTFELTARCNLNCKMCYIHTTNCEEIKKQELPAKEWMRIADEMKKSGVLIVLLTGGEAMLREDFKEIFVYLKKSGFNVNLNTNGTLINEEWIKFFKEYPPSRICLSLYGANDETYERVTGKKGMYERAINGALLLKEAGLPFRISCSVTQYNSADFPAIFEWAKQHDIPVQSACYMFPPERSGGVSSRPTAAETARNMIMCEKTRYSADEYRERIIAKSKGLMPKQSEDNITDDFGERLWCRAGKSTFWITYKGDLTPCGMMNSPSISLLQTDFESGWQYIHSEAGKITMPSKCKNCEYRAFCDVCAAACNAETGSFDKVPEYLCLKAKTYYELIQEELKNVQNQ